MNSRNSRVPISKKTAYAAPAFALAVVGIPIYVYLPKFYTDVVGIHIGVLGLLLLAVRLFDAITDPLIGVISDSTRTRFGRRRPYMALGSLALAGVIYLIFNPPEGTPGFETLWFGIWIFCLFLFWTIVTVPYESLGPEISFNYHERTVLFSMRDGALIAGTLVAASSPFMVSKLLSLADDPQGERERFFWISVIYCPLVIGMCWWCVLAIRERIGHALGRGENLVHGLRQCLQNRPFIILLIAYAVAAFGSNLPATLILYYVQYVLGSAHADLFLVLYFVTGIFFLPGWVFVSKRIGKKYTWIASMAVNTGAFVGVFFLGPGDAWIYGVLVFFSGIGFGATLAIPSAMQADVIDYDELLYGKRREGQYIGIWSIAKKLAAALGVGISLSVLGISGYSPNVEQSEHVLFSLRLLYSLVPSVCNLVALFIALAYPINSTRHEEIRAAIEKRGKGLTVLDPLEKNRQLNPFSR
jgi:GPH family glycoside/pentoside/hexuronide:cation symporter